MTHHLLDSNVRKSFTALCWNIGTPVAYKAILALKRDDWRFLTSMKIDVGGYFCPQVLSGDLQIAAFFKKYEGFNLGFDLKANAVLSFFETEKRCYQSNEFLSPLLFDFNHYGKSAGTFIRAVREQVRSVLGRCPDLSELDPRFGPGSTYLDVGPYITVPDKMSDNYTMTRSARGCLPHWDQTAWSRYASANLSGSVSDLEIQSSLNDPFFHTDYAAREGLVVRGNRFTSVVKDAWKRRGICIEPSINLFYQLGCGEWMTKRMGRKLGWYKSTKQDFHRFLAQLGSLTRGNATIDLSNASDTICTNFVKLVLPDDWFQLLDNLRSHFTFIGEKWVRLEKFSSMGNGFTFELETILFDSIARVVCRHTEEGMWHENVVSVFGDDIIVPRQEAKKVIAALVFFGFSVNESKTFVDGEFRESCGGDFFRGANVRPHYLKEPPSEPHQYIALANGLRRFGVRHILCGGPDVYRYPWICILKAIPSRISACRGPEHLGDQVIQDGEERWNFTVRGSIRYFRVWRPIPVIRTGWSHFRPGVVLASALYGVSDGSPQGIRRPSHRCPVTDRPVMDVGGVLTRVNGSFVSGYRFGRVMYS